MQFLSYTHKKKSLVTRYSICTQNTVANIGPMQFLFTYRHTPLLVTQLFYKYRYIRMIRMATKNQNTIR